MKGIIVLLSLLIFIFDVEAKSPGETGATFLKIGIGAKSISMGEAFCAVADDPSTIYYNPAGLSLFETKALSFTHISWFEKINYEYLTYLNPLQESGIKIPGVFATSLAYLGIDDIKEYGSTKDSYLGTFKASDLLFNLSYARAINPYIFAGTNLKFISQKIKSSSNAVVIDVGCLSKTPIKNLTAGLTFQNIAIFNNFKDDLPFNIKLGSGYKLLDNLLTLAMDVDLPDSPKLHLGIEYLYPEMEDIDIAVRLGYKTGVDEGKLSFGFGVEYDKYKLDYAYSSYNDLGDIHQFSFNIKFDKTNPQPTKIDKTEQIPFSSTSSGAKSNVGFVSEGEKITKQDMQQKSPDKSEMQISIIKKESEIVIEESEEETFSSIDKKDMEKQIVTPVVKKEESIVIEEPEEETSLSIDKKEDKNNVVEEIEKEQETPLLIEETKIQETLEQLKNNYSNAKVTIK